MLTEKNLLNDEDIRKLVSARLSVLSSDTMISIGSDGNFSRDELLEHVKEGDKVGEKIAQIQIEWLRSLKSGLI